jgi:4-amino-4-deoxy-L-arabinose transferase-like glycosyltransferase
VSATLSTGLAASARTRRRLAAWWPLAALLLLAAGLRLSTLDLQSFWYDEAFTPVRVLHAGLGATLHSVVHTENSPPLWYLLAWLDVRLFGDGELALRLPSALAGIATVGVAWAIGGELAGERCALACAALVAVNPLFVWYSQEARVYALFALTSAVAMLCCLRAWREPSRGRMAAFALSGSVALLTHYFAAFLLLGMAAWLLRARRRAALGAVAVLALVGLALLPLIIAQGGHGTQWIGRWALSSRLQAIPQYYLTGYSGAPLGHGIELLVALPIIAALGLVAARAGAGGGGTPAPGAQPALRTAGWTPAQGVALVAGTGILIPLALAVLGADYLAPRNLLGAMIPITALLALLFSSPAAGRAAWALAGTAAVAFLTLSIDVNLSPRLQRGNWRGVAHALSGTNAARALTTVELGAAPLEYYLAGLRNLHRGSSVSVREIDETGYAPLRAPAGRTPAPGFGLRERLDVDGLIAYRFFAATPRAVSEATLRRHVITLAHPEVLVPAGAHVTSAPVRG